jgi:hypothetical protein
MSGARLVCQATNATVSIAAQALQAVMALFCSKQKPGSENGLSVSPYSGPIRKQVVTTVTFEEYEEKRNKAMHGPQSQNSW